ncbi:myotubularin-related protein 10-A isoform X2 [Frankliniella occidentalis]|uniref:Myotubularin-related protein 10-A isoform X2 n=1 Tax=Frankliniella occidentalis TaxID=133901 RepID=A0A6J1TDA3_FRAOC|nr:myotubularin-related protein 10-A isoform X2 [Frankliniella occidentalis]
MFKTHDKRVSMSFRSYVGFNDQENKDVDIGLEENFDETLNTRLLAGEAVVAEAQNVLMFAPLSEKKGKSGILTVTNFKLSFVTTEERPRDERGLQENLLLGEYDVCLANVDEIYQMIDKDKRRKMMPGNNISGKVKGLYIVCKNMRVIQFSFKFSPVGHGKTLTNALLHHAFPRKHHLLFAYDFRERYYNSQGPVTMFNEKKDWEKEIRRTGAVGWKLSDVNQGFQLSTSLPQCLVVPDALVDYQLTEAARHFRCNRPPTWCWSSSHGAALVRMADLLPTITDRMLVIQPSVIRHSGLSNIIPETRTPENIMLENVRKGHPQRTQPELMELTQDLPSPKDVYGSYCKLRDLCTPDNVRQFWIQDNHFLSQVESSKWLTTVSACLTKAAKAATFLQDNITVVLQEADGRDMSCLISSLTQLLVDAHFRTILGFQTLLQKEWIAMGHPFCSRLGHILNPEVQQSPILLLFLDCVWQLLRQFPSAFEFTETYLTTLWDCAHITVFDTFLFDCEHERQNASQDQSKKITLRSLWDWGEQFLEKDIALFRSPLYHPSKSEAVLNVLCSLPNLALWSQCFFRWIPILELKAGGYPQIDLGVRALHAQIDYLREQLAEAKAGERTSNHRLCAKLSKQRVTSFFPFSATIDPVISPALLNSTLALNNSFVSNEALLDSQSLLNAPD